jgi:hypothetical protein
MVCPIARFVKILKKAATTRDLVSTVSCSIKCSKLFLDADSDCAVIATPTDPFLIDGERFAVGAKQGRAAADRARRDCGYGSRDILKAGNPVMCTISVLTEQGISAGASFWRIKITGLFSKKLFSAH